MPENAWVGFQTNGLLLDQKRSESLVCSCVDAICISVDSIYDWKYENIRNGSRFENVCEAFFRLRTAKKMQKSTKPEIGIEFVLKKDNAHELPGLIEWAHHMDASFVIVSHLLPYKKRFSVNGCL
jgi:molybdenum cofactor biosynthesis enzyme MoaA